MSSRRSRLWASWRAVTAAIVTLGVVALAPAEAAPSPNGSDAEGVLFVTTLSPAFVPPDAPVVLRVEAPAFSGLPLDFEQLNSHGWSRVAQVTVDASGIAQVTLRLHRSGTYDFRVQYDFFGQGGPYSIYGDTRRVVVTAISFGDPLAYRFSGKSHSGPWRWSGCRTITYRANLTNASPGAAADLHEAIRRLQQVTGFTFRNLGSTSQVPGGAGFRQDAALDIAWATPSSSTYLSPAGPEPGAAHITRSVTDAHGRREYTAAAVVIDAARTAKMPSGFGSGVVQGMVLLHELGHVMGLADVTAADQMMRGAPDTTSRAALYGAGDLAGLRMLSRPVACH